MAALLLPTARSAPVAELNGLTLVDVTIRCHSQAAKTEDMGGLWHNLAHSYRLRADMFEKRER